MVGIPICVYINYDYNVVIMNKICTSIEQSKKLIELGLDVKTADMYHTKEIYPNKDGKRRTSTSIGNMPISRLRDIEFIPAWSLSALLNDISKYDFIIKCIKNQYNIDIPERHCKIWFSSLLDAAFEMVCWSLENKKLI